MTGAKTQTVSETVMNLLFVTRGFEKIWAFLIFKFGLRNQMASHDHVHEALAWLRRGTTMPAPG